MWRKKAAWIIPHLPSGTLVSSRKHGPGLGSIASAKELMLKSPCSLLSQQQKAFLSFMARSVLCASATCLNRNLQETGV